MRNQGTDTPGEPRRRRSARETGTVHRPCELHARRCHGMLGFAWNCARACFTVRSARRLKVRLTLSPRVTHITFTKGGRPVACGRKSPLSFTRRQIRFRVERLGRPPPPCPRSRGGGAPTRRARRRVVSVGPAGMAGGVDGTEAAHGRAGGPPHGRTDRHERAGRLGPGRVLWECGTRRKRTDRRPHRPRHTCPPVAARDALLPAEPADAIRDDCGWEPVNWETDCRPSGEYRLVVFMDGVGRVTGQGGGYEIVPAPDHRLPQPGIRQEAASVAPAGDPEPAATRFRACLQRRVRRRA